MVSTDVKGFSTEGQRVPSAWPFKVKWAGDGQMTVMHLAPKPFLTVTAPWKKEIKLGFPLGHGSVRSSLELYLKVRAFILRKVNHISGLGCISQIKLPDKTLKVLNG